MAGNVRPARPATRYGNATPCCNPISCSASANRLGQPGHTGFRRGSTPKARKFRAMSISSPPRSAGCSHRNFGIVYRRRGRRLRLVRRGPARESKSKGQGLFRPAAIGRPACLARKKHDALREIAFSTNVPLKPAAGGTRRDETRANSGGETCLRFRTIGPVADRGARQFLEGLQNRANWI